MPVKPVKLNLDNIKNIKPAARNDYLLFLRVGSYSGKIFVDPQGNILSNAIKVHHIPYRNANGDVVYRNFRYYPGNPIEQALKQLSEEGYLGGASWKYEPRLVVKFYFYAVDFPEDHKNANPGPYLAVLRGASKVRDLREFLDENFFSAETEEELQKRIEEAAPYFDPSYPTPGITIKLKDKKGGGGVFLKVNNAISVPAFEPPDWWAPLDDIYIPSHESWQPTKEYIQELEQVAESFYRLGVEGYLNPKVADEISKKKLSERVSFPRAVPLAPKAKPEDEPPWQDDEEEAPFERGAGRNPVQTPSPQKLEVKREKATSGVEVEVVKTEVDLGVGERYHPKDERAGGPYRIFLDVSGLPLCYGNFDSSVPKCRACTYSRFCVAPQP